MCVPRKRAARLEELLRHGYALSLLAGAEQGGVGDDVRPEALALQVLKEILCFTRVMVLLAGVVVVIVRKKRRDSRHYAVTTELSARMSSRSTVFDMDDDEWT